MLFVLRRHCFGQSAPSEFFRSRSGGFCAYWSRDPVTRSWRHLLLFSRRVALDRDEPRAGVKRKGNRGIRREPSRSFAESMIKNFDIAVIGSGAAGMAAAVAAGREGCSTLLLDQKHGAGGTGGFSGLTTLCGLYDDEGKMLNNGLTHEFAESLRETEPLQMGRVWVLPYRPDRFRQVAQQMLAATN